MLTFFRPNFIKSCSVVTAVFCSSHRIMHAEHFLALTENAKQGGIKIYIFLTMLSISQYVAYFLFFLIMFTAFMFVFCPDDESALSTHDVLSKEDAYAFYGQITVCLKGHPRGFKKTLGFDPRAPQLFNTTQYILVVGPKRFPNYRLIESGIFLYCYYYACTYFFLR